MTESQALSLPLTRPEAARAGFWAGPWRYPQAMTVVICFVGIAAIIQAARPETTLALPAAPWNWLIVFAPLALLALARRVWPGANPGANPGLGANPGAGVNPGAGQVILAGLGGIPMAITSLAALALLSLPAGIWPVGEQAPQWMHNMGMAELFASFPFNAALVLVLVNLALAVGKRLWPWQRGTFTFLLVHVGVLLAIGGATAGSATLVRAQVAAFRDSGFTNMAQIDGRHMHLPFAIRLEKFTRENFPPRLMLAELEDPEEGLYLTRPGQKLLDEGVEERLGKFRIRIEQYLPQAAVVGQTPRPFFHDGAGPAVEVAVYSHDGAPLGGGWLHARTQFGHEMFLHLDDEHVLMMQPPRPRSYRSRISWITPESEEPVETEVAVNAPASIAGWKLYQHSYDQEKGSASSYSVFEAVRDPALPVVYVGMFMLMAGVSIQFWQTARRLVVNPPPSLRAAGQSQRNDCTDREAR